MIATITSINYPGQRSRINKPGNPHETTRKLLARLNKEEVCVRSLPINERTPSQQKSIYDIDRHISYVTEQEDSNVDVDAMPPPFQYPRCQTFDS